jgi:hypothetical protein
MELNARILLLVYMVYLYPKHSLGYQLHSTFRQLQAIIMYMRRDWQHNYGANPLLFCFPLLIPFCFPSISFY